MYRRVREEEHITTGTDNVIAEIIFGRMKMRVKILESKFPYECIVC